MRTFLVCVIALIALTACSQEIVCNRPYIRYASSCCLDTNNNSICDNDESGDGPAASSTLFLTTGLLSHQEITADNRAIIISAGARIVGNVTVAYGSDWPGTQKLMVIPSWSGQGIAAADISRNGTATVAIDLKAPLSPGTYYLFIGYHPNMTQFSSLSGWMTGGDEAVANALNQRLIDTADAEGKAQADFTTDNGIQKRTVPLAAVKVVVKGPVDGALSTLSVSSGTINAQKISSSHPRITVAPGERISGSIELEYYSSWNSNAVISLGGTPSWGDHATGFVDLGQLSTPGAGKRQAQVDLIAPKESGTYHIIYVFSGEFDAAHVMSVTGWPAGGPVWNDGNDVASWSDLQIQAAEDDGRVPVSYDEGSYYVPFIVPATSVEVDVK